MRTATGITFSLAGVAVMAALSLYVAALHLPMADWPAWPFDVARMSMNQIILAYAVFPRAFVAILAGAALGLSGALFQQLLRNPIAEPSTLGVSAGAQLAIVAATLFSPSLLDGYRSLVALAGASAAAILVFALGWRRDLEPVTMVIGGLLVGMTAGALSAALTLSQGEYLMSLVTWNGGSLSQQDWSVAGTLAVELAVGGILTIFLVRPLIVLSLGDSGARSLGVGLTFIRVAVGVVAVGLAAAVAAAVGLVSFIGLAAPAIARGFGARRPGSILLAAPIAGALLLWLCDSLVQLFAAATSETFPTGAVTALVGGPLLLWLLPRVRHPESLQSASADPGRKRGVSGLLVLGIVFIVILALAATLGRSTDGWFLLSGADIGDVLPLRWPRLLAAASAGALLAVSGAILQRLTGNPMASPEVIGVSGGSGVGFAVAISLVPAAGPLELLVGAGGGAICVMLVVLAFASKRHLPPERLLLAGIAVSSLSSAILAALLAVGDQRSWQILAWLGGSASTSTAMSASVLAIMAVLSLAISLVCTRWLMILPFGQSLPIALGLPVRRARIILILIAGVATGAASLLVGPLSFVGLMAPHIAARAGFWRARDHIAASFLLGAVLMTIADLGARTVTFPYELPLGLFAALVGAPYLVWLIGKRQ
ncbi:Fe(3+)-hydroxamate ABC transporter permease FhuB [Rhizobium sp. S152]|uniref:Fe(3+)-hydroxamate ABC transporter permease FhuB n=1 Tax=Rhizobium sp. S152 TaxID=3055038 RepID=UPI0025A99D06|nr:Fe(3+)-hydroxamate ABC transporter permease FhuB [Rhizobium sp. S152]MDM9627908.1 Fe(3+)-hydroxamate ABC transporter permease FhuB [Rhizobium sp. S152]